MATEQNESARATKIEAWAWRCVWLGIALVIAVAAGRWSEPLGDTIGGAAGTMFALAGVFLFYAALLHQRVELRLQRDDLRLQRQELGLQREELKATTEALLAQREEMERGRKAGVTLNLAFKLEESRVARTGVISTIMRYYKMSDRSKQNDQWGLRGQGSTGFDNSAFSPDRIAVGMANKRRTADAAAIEEMLSLLAVCRLAWTEELVDRSDLAEILKPEVLDLQEIYNHARQTTSITLDRYTRGHEWLVEVAKKANVSQTTC